MAFITSLIIITSCNYFALYVYFKRHKKQFSSMPDLSADISLSKKKKNTKEVNKDCTT